MPSVNSRTLSPASRISRRSFATSGCIQVALCQLQHLPEIGVPDSAPLNEIDMSREEIFESELQTEVRVPAVETEDVIFELHHEIQIARRRIERPLHRRPENR